MSAARKILFSGPEGSANIEGLIESMRKTSPAMVTRMEQGGGRVMGEAMADYSDKLADNSPNASRIMQQKKV